MAKAKSSGKRASKAPKKRPVRRAQKRPAKDGTRRGRKPLLDETIIEKLEEAYEAGASVRDAAGYAGIGYQTLFTYLEKADGGEADPIYRELRDRLEVARAKGNVEDLQALRLHGRTDARAWKALAHRLAVRDPDNYSERRRLELVGAGGGPIQFYLPRPEGQEDDE